MLTGIRLVYLSRHTEGPIGFTDPLVMGSGLVWLLMVGFLVWLLRSDRVGGKQVALRTIWAFGLVLVTLLGLQVLFKRAHVGPGPSEWRVGRRGSVGENRGGSPPMNVQVVYCTHQTTPLALRERLAFASVEQLTRAYESLRATFPNSEHVVLSTCNRVEIYAAQDESNAPLTQEQVAEFLSRFHGVPRNDLYGALLWQKGPEAVRHLFEVASSLDSMVLGEPQIVSQVKEAYRVAQDNDACGPLDARAFSGSHAGGRPASAARRRWRSGESSVASVAVGEFGKSIFDRFADKTVVLIGAGRNGRGDAPVFERRGSGGNRRRQSQPGTRPAARRRMGRNGTPV